MSGGRGRRVRSQKDIDRDRDDHAGRLLIAEAAATHCNPSHSTAPDTSETVYISSLALLKMLKHGGDDVPMEAMGVMLGDFPDEFTVNVVDVFPMPQSDTPGEVSERSADLAYLAKMMNMLKQTDRSEIVVGWYHTHPGLGCYLNDTDRVIHKSFEALHAKAIAVVIDPTQSVPGKVDMDAYRLVSDDMCMGEYRQHTSNLGPLRHPTPVALNYGLGRHYYSIRIDIKCKDNESEMLSKIHQQTFMDPIPAEPFSKRARLNESGMQNVLKLTGKCKMELEEEERKPLTNEQLEIKYFGKQDAKRHIEEEVKKMLNGNIPQLLGAMTDVVSYQDRRNKEKEGEEQQ